MGVPFSSTHFAELELFLTSLIKNENKKFVSVYDVIEVIQRAGAVAIYAEVLEELRLEAGITDGRILEKINEFKKRSDQNERVLY